MRLILCSVGSVFYPGSPELPWTAWRLPCRTVRWCS